MIKEIIKDPVFLSQKSVEAGEKDFPIAEDLLDTLNANKERCVGLAANMIGKSKRIIVIENDGAEEIMFNPVIIKQSERYVTEEGCLSLDGLRKTYRWKKIKVKYQNIDFQTRIKTYTGGTAQIIQHEIDHCNGRLI